MSVVGVAWCLSRVGVGHSDTWEDGWSPSGISNQSRNSTSDTVLHNQRCHVQQGRLQWCSTSTLFTCPASHCTLKWDTCRTTSVEPQPHLSRLTGTPDEIRRLYIMKLFCPFRSALHWRTLGNAYYVIAHARAIISTWPSSQQKPTDWWSRSACLLTRKHL